MPLLPDETVRTAAIDAIVKAIRASNGDPWRQARLLAFVRKERQHSGLREVAAELLKRERRLKAKNRKCYWAALELLTEPSPIPPKEGALWIEPVSGVCFVRIRPGKFRMGLKSEEGSELEEEDSDDDERPAHEVEITREYWLGRHAVTKGEYQRFLEANKEEDVPWNWKNPRFNGGGQPVIGVSWEDAELNYVEWLRKQTGLSFHLPTEAEWEFGCRGGNPGQYCFGDLEKDLSNYAWFGAEVLDISESTHVVGMKWPNEWGLQDMHGNVWEWCWDWFDSYPSQPQSDPLGPRWDTDRVIRGGGWTDVSKDCRSASRSRFLPFRASGTLGFRLALSPVRRPEAG